MNVNDEQPAPKTNDNQPVWELVIEDMKKRDQVGRERYGTPLQTFNGRDPLVDAYQEVLDLAVYLRQAVEEKGLFVDPIPHRLALQKENKFLKERVDELQTRCTELIQESRDYKKRLTNLGKSLLGWRGARSDFGIWLVELFSEASLRTREAREAQMEVAKSDGGNYAKHYYSLAQYTNWLEDQVKETFG